MGTTHRSDEFASMYQRHPGDKPRGYLYCALGTELRKDNLSLCCSHHSLLINPADAGARPRSVPQQRRLTCPQWKSFSSVAIVIRLRPSKQQRDVYFLVRSTHRVASPSSPPPPPPIYKVRLVPEEAAEDAEAMQQS